MQEPLAQSNFLQELVRFGGAHSVHRIEQRQGDVLHRSGVGQKVELLEHETDRSISQERKRVLTELPDFLAVQPIRACIRDIEQA